MKRILYFVAAVATVLSSCGKTPEEQNVSLTGVSFSQPAFSVQKGTPEALEVVFTPANATNKNLTWESSAPEVITVDQNGLASAVADTGEATITIISEEGNYTASCTVTVNWLGEASFRTDKTWTVGSQTWSDVVMATRCLKDDYSGVYESTPLVIDCRRNGDYGHLFSWTAVNTYATQLCPEPWRTPVAQDFVDLDMALGGNGTNRPIDMVTNKFLDSEIWGGEYGGYCWIQNANDTEVIMDQQGKYALYWADESSNRNNGASLMFGIDLNIPNSGYMVPRSTSHKNNGATLRCIK